MGIHRINWKDRTATTGAVIGEKAYWDKGYGSEAKMLVLDYAFNMLNLRKICSQVLAFNKRSHPRPDPDGGVQRGLAADMEEVSEDGESVVTGREETRAQNFICQ